MADVTIEAVADDSLDSKATRAGPFWTSPTVGYVIYLDTNGDLVYRKTENGGADWGGATVLVAPSLCNAPIYDCWADWQTAGDAGTKIHVAYMSLDTEKVRYVCLDTSDDSITGSEIETCQGTGIFSSSIGRLRFFISITKTRGGNLAVAFRYEDNLPTTFYGFYTSPDATNWTSEASPWDAAADYILLFPGNEVDNQDVWATFWDISADEILLKTYDDSENSWSEQLISGSMDKGDGDYCQMDGIIRLNDGHLIFAAWSEKATATADLMTWDINGAGSITAKTNVITNEDDTLLVSVFVNQINDDIYVSYVSGADWVNLKKAFYQKSVNGGTNWGGEQAMQADAEDDERWISAGAIKEAWGGKFQPVWFNDDDNDLFTNSDNGISIAAAGGVTHYGVATLSGVGTLAGIGHGIFIGKSTLSGTGTLAAIGRGIFAGAATLAGMGTLSAIGSFLHYAKATLSGIGSLTAAGTTEAIKYGAATLSGTGTLVAKGVGIFAGKATLTGVGSLVAVGRGIFVGSATLAGTGTLAVIGSIAAVGRLLKVVAITSQYRDLNIITAQNRLVKAITAMYRKVK